GFALERDGRVRLLAGIDLSALPSEQKEKLGTLLESYFSVQKPERSALRARAALLRNDRDAACVHAEAAAQAGRGPLERAYWLRVLCTLTPEPTRYALRLCAELITAADPRRALSVLEGLPPEP